MSSCPTFSEETLEQLRIGKGDTVYVYETRNGIELTPYDKEFAAQMQIAEQVMREGIAQI